MSGILVCSSFSDKCVYVCCVESFAHIKCYRDCSRRGIIWLNPFATVLFNVSSAVLVECCVLYPRCAGMYDMFAVMYGRRFLLQCL